MQARRKQHFYEARAEGEYGMGSIHRAAGDKNLSQQLPKGNKWLRRDKGIKLSIADTRAH